MLEQVGPSHTLAPEYWEEAAREYGITLRAYAEMLLNAHRGSRYEIICDLTPDHLRSDYLSAYRAAAHDYFARAPRA